MGALSPLDFAAPAITAPHPDTRVQQVPWHGLSLGTLARTLAALVGAASPLPAALTQRQLAVLLHLGTTEGPHTVRGLATALRLSKPAITRAIDTLATANLVARQPDRRDRRSVLVALTRTGRTALRELAVSLAAPLESA